MNEITFIVTVHGQGTGYTARAGSPGDGREIVAAGKHRDELIQNIHEALALRFRDAGPEPGVIHLHFVRDPS